MFLLGSQQKDLVVSCFSALAELPLTEQARQDATKSFFYFQEVNNQTRNCEYVLKSN